MPLRHIVRVALLTAVPVVTACQEMDPYTRPGTWQPTGVNAGNIAAQVADPYDLIRGRGTDIKDSRSSDIGIGRVWTDKPKALLVPGGPGSGTGTGTGSGGGGTSPGGPGG